jgi:glucosamine--fructose-6-phosphate aminotransferase (isomerizing)
MNRYFDEIIDQSNAIIRAVDRFPIDASLLGEILPKIASGTIKQLILTGMGSSFYSCYPIFLTLSNFGVPVSLWDTSELVNFAPNLINEKNIIIAVSQSGESAEIKRLISSKKRPGLKIGVTNNDQSSLANWSDLTLGLYAGDEAAVSTKTYINSLAVLHLVASKITGQKLKDADKQMHRISGYVDVQLKRLIYIMEEMAEFLSPIDNLALLGRGYSLGSAMYGSLILEEASNLFTFGLSSAQFRHGPLELANPGFRAVVFSGGEATQALNERITGEIASYGGRVLYITSKIFGEFSSNVKEIEIPAVECQLLPFLEILPIQLLTISLAETKGLEAGVLQHGNKITEVE